MLGSTIQLSLGKRTTQVSRATEFFREQKVKVNKLLQGRQERMKRIAISTRHGTDGVA